MTRTNIITSQILHFLLENQANLVPNTRKMFDESNQLLFHSYIAMQKILCPTASVEIGAHFAEYSQTMRTAFPDIDIIAAEANPYTFKMVTERVDFSKLNIQYHNIAISNEEASIPFYIPRYKETGELYANKGMGSVVPFFDTAYVEKRNLDFESIDVQSITGKKFIESNTKSTAISVWMDVEGANEVVLKSLAMLLARKQILSLYIEVEQTQRWKNQWLDKDVTQYLLQFGYIPILRDAQTDVQYNTIYINADLVTVEISKIKNEYLAELQRMKSKEIACKNIFRALLLELNPSFTVKERQFLIRQDFTSTYMQIYIVGMEKFFHFEFFIDISSDLFWIGLHSESSDSAINEKHLACLDVNSEIIKAALFNKFSHNFTPRRVLDKDKPRAAYEISLPLTPYAISKYAQVMKEFINETIVYF